MAKAGALEIVRRRSQSSGWPVMRACSGAGIFGTRSASWSLPSVIKIAPAMRPCGSSAIASDRAVINCVPASPSPSPTVTMRASTFSSRASSASTLARAVAFWSGRSPTDWLALSSTTTITMSDNGVRFSCWSAGFKRASTRHALAKARNHQPDSRRQSAKPTTARARTPTATIKPIGSRGSKSRVPFIAPTFPEGRAHALGRTYSCR